MHSFHKPPLWPEGRSLYTMLNRASPFPSPGHTCSLFRRMHSSLLFAGTGPWRRRGPPMGTPLKCRNSYFNSSSSVSSGGPVWIFQEVSPGSAGCRGLQGSGWLSGSPEGSSRGHPKGGLEWLTMTLLHRGPVMAQFDSLAQHKEHPRQRQTFHVT